MTRSAWRKRLKITGLVLSLLMLALWIFSVMFGLSYISAPAEFEWSITMVRGRITFYTGTIEFSSGWTCWQVILRLRGRSTVVQWTRFASESLGLNLPYKTRRTISIPFWLLIVAVGIPTGILWWRDRRPKAGFCKACEYDLTGNVSGTCPECGTTVE